MPGNFWKNPTGTISKTLAGNTREMKAAGKFFNGNVESADVNTDTYTEVHYEPIVTQQADDNTPKVSSSDSVVTLDINNNNVASAAEPSIVITLDNNNETNIPPVSTLGDSVNIVD